MTLAKWVSGLGVLAMAAVLVYGFTVGEFAREGTQLISMPWGIVSLVDLYVGFTLFSGWILSREGLNWKSLIWVLLMMVLGFFAGALYTFLALRESQGDWTRFWMGKNSSV
jgi:pilus assembly protein TadC